MSDRLLTSEEMAERSLKIMELNPNHKVTQEVHNHWHKVAALLVLMKGGRVTIPESEIAKLEGKAVTIKFVDGIGIELAVVSMEEGERLARQEGGLLH